MSDILKRRVNTQRFQKALSAYLINSHILALVQDENGDLKEGGFLDYFLINSNKFSKEEFEDYVKFCKAYDYLSPLVFDSCFKTKTVSVQQVLTATHANIIFKYKFNDPKFQRWQEHVLDILTFQDLTDTI